MMNEFIGQMSPEVYDAIGVAGFGLYVMNYSLLTLDKLRSQHVAYFILNFCAASMVLIGLLHSFNLASALIQVFWIGISTVGIIMRVRRGHIARHDQTAPDVTPPLPFESKRAV